MKPKPGQKVIAMVTNGADVTTVMGTVLRLESVGKTQLVVVEEDEAEDPGTVSTAWAFDRKIFRHAPVKDGVIHVTAEGA